MIGTFNKNVIFIYLFKHSLCPHSTVQSWTNPLPLAPRYGPTAVQKRIAPGQKQPISCINHGGQHLSAWLPNQMATQRFKEKLQNQMRWISSTNSVANANITISSHETVTEQQGLKGLFIFIASFWQFVDTIDSCCCLCYSGSGAASDWRHCWWITVSWRGHLLSLVFHFMQKPLLCNNLQRFQSHPQNRSSHFFYQVAELFHRPWSC